MGKSCLFPSLDPATASLSRRGRKSMDFRYTAIKPRLRAADTTGGTQFITIRHRTRARAHTYTRTRARDFYLHFELGIVSDNPAHRSVDACWCRPTNGTKARRVIHSEHFACAALTKLQFKIERSARGGRGTFRSYSFIHYRRAGVRETIYRVQRMKKRPNSVVGLASLRDSQVRIRNRKPRPN